MTTLTKSIKREVAVPRMRPVIIEIDPERASIGFHEKGTRRTFWLPIMTAYAMAVRTDKEG
jgi:hypothetical protein